MKSALINVGSSLGHQDCEHHLQVGHLRCDFGIEEGAQQLAGRSSGSTTLIQSLERRSQLWKHRWPGLFTAKFCYTWRKSGWLLA